MRGGESGYGNARCGSPLSALRRLLMSMFPGLPVRLDVRAGVVLRTLCFWDPKKCCETGARHDALLGVSGPALVCFLGFHGDGEYLQAAWDCPG